jgi:putative membrane protein
MFINKIIAIALGSVFLFFLACDNRTTESETTEVTYTLDKHEPSAMFWDYAASTSMLQKELGKLATEKAEDSLIQTYADSALLIHSKALLSLRNLAGKYKNIQLPDSLTGSDKEMVEEFKALQGEDFESRYVEYLTLTHKAQLNRYQETLSETDDPSLRQWLTNMRTRLSNQLQFYAEADSVTPEE